MPITRPWYDEAPNYGDAVAIPRVWLTLVLSVLLHILALLLVLPLLKNVLMPGPVDGPQAPPLSIKLAQAPAARPPPQPQPSPPAATPPPPPRAAPRQRPAPTPPRTPPVLAVRPQQRNPDAFRVPPPPVMAPPAPTPKPLPPPAEADLQSYIAARRAARGETAAPSTAPAPESDTARRDRIVAQNMAAVNKPQAYAGEPRNGGGLFELVQVSYDNAQFKFFGWNKDIKRKATQMIDVSRGSNPDINIAIVRKMIAIIRENVTGDFTWRSDKIGHEVTLSARPEDNAALEEFLMRDMFAPGGPPGATAQRR